MELGRDGRGREEGAGRLVMILVSMQRQSTSHHMCCEEDFGESLTIYRSFHTSVAVFVVVLALASFFFKLFSSPKAISPLYSSSGIWKSHHY